jgi:hypothetical protein
MYLTFTFLPGNNKHFFTNNIAIITLYMMKTVGAKLAILFLFIIAFLGVFHLDAEAAFLYFNPLSSDVHRGDTMAIDLRIDTDEGECINTIDGVIHYDESVRAVDVSRGESILSVWLEEPIIDEENREIRFAGGIPGGYCGRIAGDPKLTNVVITILFRSPGFSIGGEKTPVANIELDSASQVLLHDGFGTPAPLRFQNALLTLLNTPGTAQSDAWRDELLNDKEPPSDFSITLTTDETAFGGRYFIVFNSLDKQSGIDHYEVFEEPFSEFWSFKWGRADTPWQSVESPYVLKDQSLNSTIWVKALDKAGNERIVKLVPNEAKKGISQATRLTMTLAGAAVILFAALAVYFLRRRNQANKNSDVNENENEN